jgi:DNA-binding NtrC family response regulator
MLSVRAFGGRVAGTTGACMMGSINTQPRSGEGNAQERPDVGDANARRAHVMAMADILIIDDDRQMRRILTRVLHAAGHTVREAEDGRGGIAAFRRARPALVISDIVMPGTEGIETIRTLRDEAPAMPIIAISGGGSDTLYLRAATGLGATASLRKPFTAVALTELVGTLLADAPERRD